MLEVILNIIGIGGMVVLLVSYFLLQKGILRDDKVGYYNLSILGSAMIAASLYTNWNLPSFILQIAWMIISLAGIYRIKFKR